MTRDEVIALMESSNSAQEWRHNADEVKEACNGYPEFWWAAIIKSGLGDRVNARWGSDAQIHIHPIP